MLKKSTTEDHVLLKALQERKKKSITGTGDSEVDQHLFSLPIIYKTLDNEGMDNGVTSQHKKFIRVDPKDFDFDERASMRKSSWGNFWIKVQVCIQGKLLEGKFIKNLTLNINQAIYDYLIECYFSEKFAA